MDNVRTKFWFRLLFHTLLTDILQIPKIHKIIQRYFDEPILKDGFLFGFVLVNYVYQKGMEEDVRWEESD